MICDVCGRDNPERLTFCQECGKRLRVPTGSDAVTPTPPHGLAAHAPASTATSSTPQAPGTAAEPGTASLIAMAAGTSRGPTGPAPAGDVGLPRLDSEPIMGGVATRSDAPLALSSRRASRPEAPVFAFGFDEPRPEPTPPPRLAQTASPSELEGATCIHCGARNPRTHRFCTTCGGTLGGSTASLATSAGGPSTASPLGFSTSSALMPVAPLASQPTTPEVAPLTAPEEPAGPVYAGAASTAPIAALPADPEPPQVVPAPVVSISTQAPQVAATVTCARCQGQCSASARYCKYCGSLLEAQASAPTGAGVAASATPAAAGSPSAPSPLALIPPTSQPVVAWAPVAGGGSEGPPIRGGSGLGHAPTLPQPPQLGGVPAPARPAGPVASSSAIASLAAQAAPAAYPQPHLAAGHLGMGTQALPGAASASSLQKPSAQASAGALPALSHPAAMTPHSHVPSPMQVATRANPPGTPRLVVLRDDGSEGTAFPLGADIVDLGRRDGDVLLHDDLYVSPRHARFRREGDRVRVIDLASTNGIYLRLRGQHRLASGNLILLGLEVLQFQLVKDAAPPASPHAPSAAGPRGRGGAGASAAGNPTPAAVQPFGSDFDAIEATWAGRGNPWAASGPRPAIAAPETPVVAPPVQGFGQASQHGTLVFGSPASSRKASLQQRTIEGIVRDVYHLVRDEVVLGREGADIVFSADPFMSRRHAVIRRDPATDVYTLVDLESSNGTFVRIENDAFLKHGDEIRIGRHLFRFDREGDGASTSDQASHA